MPRPPRFRIGRIGDLFRQIAFASDDARRRQIHASEILLDEVVPGQTYRADVVAHRITGFRPERSGGEGEGEVQDDDELLVGEALIADLATFVLRLSEHVVLRDDERPGGAHPLDVMSRRLGVTQRTLQRWRQLGLPMHWIEFDGQRRMGCYQAALDAFLRRRPEVRQRRAPTRLRTEEKLRLLEDARALRGAAPASLSSVAAEVARRHGRAHETVRLLLERHDARSGQPIFTGEAVDRAPLDERDRRVIERAWRLGVPLAHIAAHFRRSVPAVHRQLMVRRRERLLGLRLRWIELPTFVLPEAEEVILAAPVVRAGLVPLSGMEDALTLLESVRRGGAGAAAPSTPGEGRVVARHVRAAEADAKLRSSARQSRRIQGRSGRRTPAIESAVESFTAEESARIEALIAGWNFLKRRAARMIAALEPVPSARTVDAVERDLRWASMVQQTLLFLALGEAVRRADLWAGRRIEEMPAEELRAVLTLLVKVCVETIDRVDPSRGNRLDRLVALETDKALARRGIGTSASAREVSTRLRAAAGHAAGSVVLAGVLAELSPWQAWLGPPSRWREGLSSLDSQQRRAVEATHGLDGCAPRTGREIARMLGASPSVATRLAAEGVGRLRWARRNAPNERRG